MAGFLDTIPNPRRLSSISRVTASLDEPGRI
jgi:hypothetical protein